MECKQYKEQLEKCTIESSVSGKVSDITIVSGSAINQGSELVKVQQGDRKDNVIVCYVALDSGKKITEGMKVLIYPTTVNKQEYGHMEATVESVNCDRIYVMEKGTVVEQGNYQELMEKRGRFYDLAIRQM